MESSQNLPSKSTIQTRIDGTRDRICMLKMVQYKRRDIQKCICCVRFKKKQDTENCFKES